MRPTTMHRVVALAATAVTFAAACGGDASSAEKSGGEPAPLTLRLGTVELEPIPYAPYVKEFVRAVGEISGGSIDVEVAWEAVPWTPESEQTLATMVGDGDIDLALVPTRVWDKLGVTSLRALQAPFLVDSLDLLNTIVSSELTDEMFAGLEPLGVEGLALWPDALRHPLSFERPLLTAADFDGAQLVVPASDTSVRLFSALGAESTDAEVSTGREAAFNIGNLYDLGTFTANITFYPKVNALVANAELLESLSDDQRDVLRRAATDTTGYAIATNRSEADLAAEYCASGGSVALADAADVAELAELAAPVVAELADDDTTNRIIVEIRELKAGMTADPATAPAACGTLIEPSAAGEVVPAEVSELPDGVYRVEITLDDVEAAGLNNGDGTTGVWTMEVDDGTWVMSCAPIDLPGRDCGNNLEAGIVAAGYLRGAGNTAWLVFDVEMVSELIGCQLPASNEPGHCGGGGDAVHVDWALDGDTLTLSNFGPGNGAFELTLKPWTRTEGADQTDTEMTSELPDGVYRVEISLDDVEAAGQSNGDGTTGIWTMKIDDGTYALGCAPLDLPGRDCGNSPHGGDVVEAGYVRGTGDTVWFVFDVEMTSELNGCQLPISQTEPGHCGPGGGFHVDWALDGETLTFSNNGPRNGGSGLTINPWTRVEDAEQSDTETASFPEGVYRAVSPTGDVITHEYRAGVWKVYSESGELFCEATYLVEDGRIWLTFATDLTLCPDRPGSAFVDAAWTLEGDQLRFSDINNGSPGAVAEFSLPWTRIDDAPASGDAEETSGNDG